MDLNFLDSCSSNKKAASSDRLDGLERKIKEILAQLNSSAESDRDRRVANDILSLQKKFDQIKHFEQKMTKMFKDFDTVSILKQLKEKAEQADVLKDFSIMDTKIETNKDGIQHLRKDVDNLVLIYRKLIQTLNGATQENSTMLVTKKLHAVNNINCLSCHGVGNQK